MTDDTFTPAQPATAWRVWWVSLNTARTELFEDHAKATEKASETGGCVIPLYASQPSPAATVNKKTRCESCNLLEPCADPQCPNSLTRSSAASELAKDIAAERERLAGRITPSVWRLMDRAIALLNEPQSVKVTDLSSRQLALAGEYVKEGHPMEDAIRMAHEAGDPK